MNVFGYEIKIIIVNKNPIVQVKNIIINRLGRDFDSVSHKIFAIKILREADVSKILIDAGLVPQDQIREDTSGNKFVGLAYATEWTEFYLFGMKTSIFKFE